MQLLKIKDHQMQLRGLKKKWELTGTEPLLFLDGQLRESYHRVPEILRLENEKSQLMSLAHWKLLAG